MQSSKPVPKTEQQQLDGPVCHRLLIPTLARIDLTPGPLQPQWNKAAAARGIFPGIFREM